MKLTEKFTNPLNIHIFNKNGIFGGKNIQTDFSLTSASYQGLAQCLLAVSHSWFCNFAATHSVVFICVRPVHCGKAQMETLKTLLNGARGVTIRHYGLCTYVSVADRVASMVRAISITMHSTRAGPTRIISLYLKIPPLASLLLPNLRNMHSPRAVLCWASRRCSHSKKICPTD